MSKLFSYIFMPIYVPIILFQTKNPLICIMAKVVCGYLLWHVHVLSEPLVGNWLNAEGLFLARNKYDIWNSIDYNGIQMHNQTQFQTGNFS